MRAFLLFVLVMSVIFNLLFSAGFVKARTEAKRLQNEREAAVGGSALPNDVDHGPVRGPGLGPDGGPGDGPGRRGGGGGGPMFPRELNLEPAQKEVFEQLRLSMREEEAVLDQTMAGVRGQLAEELNKDEPNIDRLRELIAQQGDLMQQRRVAAANRFADFLNVLSPEQTRIMARHMLRNMPERGERGYGKDGRDGSGPGRMPGDLMKRFDADGDGTLNETERAAAQAEFEAHRREWETKRAELRARFDADKNGELDREETTLMRQWLLENRPRERGGRERGGPGPDRHGPDSNDGPDGPPPPHHQEEAGPGDEPLVPDLWQ